MNAHYAYKSVRGVLANLAAIARLGGEYRDDELAAVKDKAESKDESTGQTLHVVSP